MNFELDYQLNCDASHNKCFFIHLKEGKATIQIYRHAKGGISLYRTIPLSFHPISSGWINDNIFLLSDRELFYLDVSSCSLQQLYLPKYKIVDLVCLTHQGNFVYSSIVDPDYIDFHMRTNNGEFQVARYHIRKNELFFSDVITSPEKEFIDNYVNECHSSFEGGISDELNGHILKIERSPLYSKLFVDKSCIANEFGCIDRAFFFGSEIIYTISSLISPSSIQIIHYRNNILIDPIVQNQNNSLFSVAYCSEDMLDIYHYTLSNNITKRGLVVMLHGGPAGRYSNRFDPMAFSFAEKGFAVYLLNYPGSTGYDYSYQEELYGKGGTVDLFAVIKSIKTLNQKYKDCPLYLIGDSYGGYLAILTLIKIESGISKVYATNAFTDIRYQFLFSCARSVITKYFPAISSPEIRKINPIDLVTHGQLKDRLLIINGVNDPYCPKQQILQFAELSGCDFELLADYPHYKVDLNETAKISNIIIRDIGV